MLRTMPTHRAEGHPIEPTAAAATYHEQLGVAAAFDEHFASVSFDDLHRFGHLRIGTYYVDDHLGQPVTGHVDGARRGRHLGNPDELLSRIPGMHDFEVVPHQSCVTCCPAQSIT